MIRLRHIPWYVLGLAVFLAQSAGAQTSPDAMRAQLLELQRQLNELTSQLTATQGGSALSGFQFVYTLYRGIADAAVRGEVSKLQQLLSEDSAVYPERLVTGYFGGRTEAAVARWQKREGLPVVGVFGPMSRAHANTILARRTPAPRPSPTPPATTTFVLSTSGNITLRSPETGSTLGSTTIRVQITGSTTPPVMLTTHGLPVGATMAPIAPCGSLSCVATATVTIRPQTPVGNAAVNIVGIRGAERATTTFQLEVLPYVPLGLSLTNSGNISVALPTYGSATATNTISVGLLGGISEQVYFTEPGLPRGVNVQSLGSCTPPCTKSNVVTVTTSATQGNSPITVVATNRRGSSATTTFQLAITNPVPFGFSLSSSGDISLAQPTSGSISASNTIIATLMSGNSQPVSFSSTGLPTGTAAGSIQACAPTCTRANTVTIRPTTPVGDHVITVRSTGGGVVSTTNYTLTVLPPVPYVINVSVSGGITLRRPSSGTTSGSNTITVTHQSGYPQTVSFSQTGLPSGAGVSSIGSCTPTCNGSNTVTINASTPVGTYPITVTVTGGGKTASTTYDLIISD